MKVAKIVKLCIITRVLVESDADDVTITDAAMNKAHNLLNTHQGSLDLLDNIEDDVECPYEPSEDGSEKYYALFDYDKKIHLKVGYNSTSQSELKKQLLSYLVGIGEKESRMNNMSLQEIAVTQNILVDCQDMPFEEDED